MILAKRKKIQTICENDGVANFIVATFNKTDYDQQKFAHDFFHQWKVFTLKLETNKLQAKYEKTIAILTKQLEQKDAEIIALKTTINNETEQAADLNALITAVSKDQDEAINLLKANYCLTQQALLQFVAQKIAPNQFTLSQDNDSGIEVIDDDELKSRQQSNNNSGDLNNSQSEIVPTFCTISNYLSKNQSKCFSSDEWEMLSSTSDEDSDSDISIIYTNKLFTQDALADNQSDIEAINEIDDILTNDSSLTATSKDSTGAIKELKTVNATQDGELNSRQQSNYNSGELNNSKRTILSKFSAVKNFLYKIQNNYSNIDEQEMRTSTLRKDNNSEIRVIYINKPITQDVLADKHSELIFC